MNEQQQLISETLNRLLTDLCTPEVVDRSESGTFAENLWQILTETGLTAAGLGVEAGGSGGDLEDSLLVIREAARFAAPVPLAEHFIAGLLLSEQGQSIESGPVTIASGKFIISDGLSLSGTANDVAFARWCTQVVLVAQGPDGLKLCRVPASDFDIVQKNSVAGEPRDAISVNTKVAAESAFSVDSQTPERIKLMGAALRALMMSGALESVLEMTVQYSTERLQFGRPISKFQAIQQQLAILAGEVAACQMASHSVVDSFSTLGELDIAIGKARIGEAVSICTDIAHQVHGAMGYTREHSLNHRTRRLWSWREEYGNEREWQKLVGRHFAAQGADKLWGAMTAL
ncbi:MAG: acyl-CoA dehydrogenase family protein [Pseudomonadales bacterium]